MALTKVDLEQIKAVVNEGFENFKPAVRQIMHDEFSSFWKGNLEPAFNEVLDDFTGLRDEFVGLKERFANQENLLTSHAAAASQDYKRLDSRITHLEQT